MRYIRLISRRTNQRVRVGASREACRAEAANRFTASSRSVQPPFWPVQPGAAQILVQSAELLEDQARTLASPRGRPPDTPASPSERARRLPAAAGRQQRIRGNEGFRLPSARRTRDRPSRRALWKEEILCPVSSS